MDAYRSDRSPDLTRRAALAGAAAFGGVGIASMVGADKALAATSEYFVNAIDYGVVGNGVANDTTALQEAIDASIETGKPLYLPPGRYRTTAGLKAEARDFAMFGAGSRLSMIVPDASSYDALTIGPGEEGSGNSPSGYARDFGFEGGSTNVSAQGVSPTTGKAAFKLDGMREFEVTNVNVEADSSFDIGFDLMNNSHGNTFHNCRTGFNGCRVGLNIRDGGALGTGSDCTFFNSWFFGEVAAVHIGPNGGGYHFYGGQFTSSWNSPKTEDERGSLILGREYLEPENTGRAATCTFDGIDFEAQQRCWIVRAYEEISISLKDCQFNGSGKNDTIGVFKSSFFVNGRVHLIDNRITGNYSEDSEGLLTLESAFDGALVFEVGSSGQASAEGSGVNFDDVPLSSYAGEFHAVAIAPRFMQMNDIALRRSQDGGGQRTLELSGLYGAPGTWVTISQSAETVASGGTIAVTPGISFVNVTGTTNIKTITATVPGHMVTLKFNASITITDGSNLKLAGSFSANGDDTLQLICDGTNWFEVGRSGN